MTTEVETLRLESVHLPAAGTLRLLILREEGWESRLLPASGTLTVGRAEDVDVRIEDRSVSRRQARLHLDGELVLEDLGSANGTRLGERTLGAGERVRLAIGQPVEMGSVMLLVQQASAPSSSPAPCSPGRSRPLPQDAMGQLWRLVDRLAPSLINVLLVGESGVGKEVVAGELHQRSRRARGPYLRLNCAALTETLLESELFGHEKGAFTGAVRTKPGLLETAAGGTVLLDEVGELPLSLQAKLLRVLEERRVLRVGGLQSLPIDVRFLFATNRDLEAEVARGAFRADLYYRLNGISLRILPLRERTSEIPSLATRFLTEAAAREALESVPVLPPETLQALLAHPWPGNIRELRNAIDRAVVLSTDGRIGPEHLNLTRSAAPRPAPTAPSPEPGPAIGEGAALEPAERLRQEKAEAEKRVVLEALARCEGNQTRAAELLGISRRTLVNRLQAYGLTRRGGARPSEGS